MKWTPIGERLARLVATGHSAVAWDLLEDCVEQMLLCTRQESLEALYRATQLAAQYGRSTRALAWIERNVERAGLTPSHDALRLGVHWITKDEARLLELLPRIQWRLLSGIAWSDNLRLALSLDTQLGPRVHSSLGTGNADVRVELAPTNDAYHHANRLRLLGFDLFERGQLKQSLIYFRKARKALAGDRTLDGQLKQIEIYGHWGKAAFREGRLDASEHYLRRATRIAARLRHQLWYDTYRLELAYIYSHRGEAARAEDVARRVARRQIRHRRPTGFQRFLYLRSLLVAGHCAADARDLRKGRRYVQRALRAHRRHPVPRLEGYIHLLRGRVAALGTTEKSTRQAEQAFSAAESIFSDSRQNDLPGRLRLSVYRGEFHIAREDASQALAESLACLELSRRHGFVPARAAGLLLKSQLLLQRTARDADRLYEEVLRDLGSIHDAVVLFRVIANLYLYSWNLDREQLDLTACHLNQIHEMRKLLEPETFHRLYERFVTRPVAKRLLQVTFGIEPGDI